MGLDAIGIVSDEIEKSIEFYKLLGVTFESVGGQDHFEADLPSGPRLMMDSLKLALEINPQWEQPKSSGVVLCFRQDSPEKVNETFSKIMESGFPVVKEPWDAFWGQRYSSVLDPNGYQIDIYCNLPRH